MSISAHIPVASANDELSMAKNSLYSAYLLGPDALDTDTASTRPNDVASLSPLPRKHLGKTSADARAAVEAAKAKRAKQEAARQNALIQQQQQQKHKQQPSIVIGDDSDDDDIPDVPDLDTVPDLSGGVPDVTPQSQTAVSPRASASPFSAVALLNARKHMRAPPSTKGVEIGDTTRQSPNATTTTTTAAPSGSSGEKTPAMLESVLQALLRDEEALDATVQRAAVDNWMRLFNGKWSTLQRLIDDYPGLIRAHALQVSWFPGDVTGSIDLTTSSNSQIQHTNV